MDDHRLNDITKLTKKKLPFKNLIVLQSLHTFAQGGFFLELIYFYPIDM
jgi:hypothetical protein